MKKKITVLFLVAFMVAGEAACSSGVSQEEYAALNEEVLQEPIMWSDPVPEILFRETQWMENPDAVKSNIQEISFMLVEDCPLTGWSDSGDIVPTLFGAESRGHSLVFGAGTEVAGYPVYSIVLDFMYSFDDVINRSVEDSRFYLATYNFDVVDVEAAYEDLKAKLDSLYSEGTECESSSSHFGVSEEFSGTFEVYERKTIWSGANDTGIQLCAYFGEPTGSPTLDASSFGLILCYGKTDSDEMLERIDQLILEEKQTAEVENRNTDDNSGL